MYATSSCLEETRRKSGWSKIVETPFGVKSWFHAASSNNYKIMFPVIWFLSRGSLELNRLTQARGSILAGHAQISRAKF